MTIETLSLPLTISRPAIRFRWTRRLAARYRLWRMGVRREMALDGLAGRQRADIGRPEAKKYRWLDEMMRGQTMRH